MTDKEKALDLIDTFETIIGLSDLNVCHTDDLDKETKIVAIECALASLQIANNILIKYGEDNLELQNMDRELLKLENIKQNLLKIQNEEA